MPPCHLFLLCTKAICADAPDLAKDSYGNQLAWEPNGPQHGAQVTSSFSCDPLAFHKPSCAYPDACVTVLFGWEMVYSGNRKLLQ